MHLIRQKWTRNETLIFFKIALLSFSTLFPVSLLLAKASLKFLSWYVLKLWHCISFYRCHILKSYPWEEFLIQEIVTRNVKRLVSYVLLLTKTHETHFSFSLTEVYSAYSNQMSLSFSFSSNDCWQNIACSLSFWMSPYVHKNSWIFMSVNNLMIQTSVCVKLICHKKPTNQPVHVHDSRYKWPLPQGKQKSSQKLEKVSQLKYLANLEDAAFTKFSVLPKILFQKYWE